MANLTVVIPFRNGHKTIACVLQGIPEKLRVIIVDDLSDLPPPVTQRKNTFALGLTRRGYFTGAINEGIRLADEADVLILNQDIALSGVAWLTLIEQQKKHYGLIGEGIAGVHPAWPNGYIHGTFMFIRRDVIDTIGLMNEIDYPLWGSTSEYQLRACRAGFKALPIKDVPGFKHDTRHLKQPFGETIVAALRQQPEKQELFIRTPPAISVVVPCYNYAHHLQDCLNSLIGGPSSIGDMKAQTFQSFEVIIVDDASTDNTQEVGLALADPWRGIHYIRLAHNVGTASCINAGVQHAHGKFITVLSADDMREADSLERLYRTCEANPHSIAYDDIMLFKDGKRIRQWAMKNYDFCTLAKRNFIHAGIMYPKAAWQEVGGYPACMQGGREDWAFNVALGLREWYGVHVTTPGYLYRREGENRSLRTGNAYPILGEEPGTQSVDWRNFFLEQLYTLFPQLYSAKGEIIMARCCGGDDPTPSSRKASPYQNPPLPGAKAGFVLLRYLGPELGSVDIKGLITGTRYPFCKDTVRFVDALDAPGLKKKRQKSKKGKLLFKEEQPVVQPEVAVLTKAAIPIPPKPMPALLEPVVAIETKIAKTPVVLKALATAIEQAPVSDELAALTPVADALAQEKPKPKRKPRKKVAHKPKPKPKKAATK